MHLGVRPSIHGDEDLQCSHIFRSGAVPIQESLCIEHCWFQTYLAMIRFDLSALQTGRNGDKNRLICSSFVSIKTFALLNEIWEMPKFTHFDLYANPFQGI